MTRTDPTPSTEAGPWDKPFLEWTVADGLAAWHGPTCRDDAAGCACPCHQPMPEQARAEGRREAVRLYEFLHHLPGCAAGYLWGTEPADQCDCGLSDAIGVAGLNASRASPRKERAMSDTERSAPRTDAGRDALHAVDMIGEAYNVDVGYKQWQKRILAIEEQARAEGRQQAVERAVRATLAVVDGTTPLSVGEPLIHRCIAHVSHALGVAGLNASESGQPPEASDE